MVLEKEAKNIIDLWKSVLEGCQMIVVDFLGGVSCSF